MTKDPPPHHKHTSSHAYLPVSSELHVGHGPTLLSRRLMLAGLLTSGGAFFARSATAGAAIPVRLDELLGQSEHVLVGTPRQSESMWEQMGDTRRIVTYTRVAVNETLDESMPRDAEVFVRTLGGVVGEIGQIVHGEAKLELEAPSVLFLRSRREGTFRVTAMAQGHYPLSPDDEGTLRLNASPRLPDFISNDRAAAAAQLRGKSLPYAHALIRRLRHGR